MATAVLEPPISVDTRRYEGMTTLRLAARAAAVVLFVWAALVALTWVTKGNYGALVAFGLALFVFGCDPWPKTLRGGA